MVLRLDVNTAKVAYQSSEDLLPIAAIVSFSLSSHLLAVLDAWAMAESTAALVEELED